MSLRLMERSLSTQIQSNKTKSWLIPTLLVGCLSLGAFFLGKSSGHALAWAGGAAIVSSSISLIAYLYIERIVLEMMGAQPAQGEHDDELIQVTSHLALAARISTPQVYIINDPALAICAVGRDPSHGTICATRGLLQRLNRWELEAVVAQALSSIPTYDTRVMTMVSVFVCGIVYLSDSFSQRVWWKNRFHEKRHADHGVDFLRIPGMLLALFSPIAAALTHLAVSRRRSYLADAAAGLLTHNPAALADALEKIGQDKRVLATATNATAHLFVVNPFKGKDGGPWFSSWFNTHPPLAQRITILKGQ